MIGRHLITTSLGNIFIESKEHIKMISQSLLNVNADKLFQQLTVEEIEDVRKKLNHEIERKREELRMMVG